MRAMVKMTHILSSRCSSYPHKLIASQGSIVFKHIISPVPSVAGHVLQVVLQISQKTTSSHSGDHLVPLKNL